LRAEGARKHTRARNLYLGVLCAESLVGGGAAGPDDGEGHVELTAGGRVRVPGAADLGHPVDAEVGVHELHDGPVAVHALTERL